MAHSISIPPLHRFYYAPISSPANPRRSRASTILVVVAVLAFGLVLISLPSQENTTHLLASVAGPRAFVSKPVNARGLATPRAVGKRPEQGLRVSKPYDPRTGLQDVEALELLRSAKRVQLREGEIEVGEPLEFSEGFVHWLLPNPLTTILGVMAAVLTGCLARVYHSYKKEVETQPVMALSTLAATEPSSPDKPKGEIKGFPIQSEKGKETEEASSKADQHPLLNRPIRDKAVIDKVTQSITFQPNRAITSNVPAPVVAVPDPDAPAVTQMDWLKLTARNVVCSFQPQFVEDGIKTLTVKDLVVLTDLKNLEASWGTIWDLLTGGFQEVTGLPVFLLLEAYVASAGHVFKLALGPRSVVVISDPLTSKHLLQSNPDSYNKGILTNILQPVMGNGLIPAPPHIWRSRRRAIVPGFHTRWLNQMMRLFDKVAIRLENHLIENQDSTVNMEGLFCSASLDIVGKAVFNYNFGSITRESPVIRAVYAVLKEVERRAAAVIPYWELPGGATEFNKHMTTLNEVLDSLIKDTVCDFAEDAAEDDFEIRCPADITLEEAQEENVSMLRFLVEMRGEDTTTQQLRDDLMTLLIAGHETTASVLTWTLNELTKPKNKKYLDAAREELEQVLGGPGRRVMTLDDVKELKFVRYCLAETLRLYPAPPILMRRCLAAETVPSGSGPLQLKPGQDIFLNVWSLHRCKELWGEDAEEFNPWRWDKEISGSEAYPEWKGFRPHLATGLYPNEIASDFAFIPFGGGSRKCVGDQFAMMESMVLFSNLIYRFDFELVGDLESMGLKMGATIQTQTGLQMKVTPRKMA